jgi:ankyrin repeat protein
MRNIKTYKLFESKDYFINKWKQEPYFTAGDEYDLFDYIENNDIDFEDNNYYLGQNFLLKICDINPHQISEYQILKLLKLLFKKGAKKYIDVQDNAGNTCLILSAYHDRLEVIRFLLDNGADWDFKDMNGDDFIYFISPEKRTILNEYPEEYNQYLERKSKKEKAKKFNL